MLLNSISLFSSEGTSKNLRTTTSFSGGPNQPQSFDLLENETWLPQAIIEAKLKTEKRQIRLDTLVGWRGEAVLSKRLDEMGLLITNEDDVDEDNDDDSGRSFLPGKVVAGKVGRT